MPGDAGLFRVKSEPLSEEDDSNSFVHSYLVNQLPSEDLRAKLGTEYLRSDNVPTHLLHHIHGSGLEELAPLAPAGPAATPVCVKQEPREPTPALTLETLEPAPHSAEGAALIDRHLALLNASDDPEATEFMPGEDTSDSSGTQPESAPRCSPKTWTQKDMDNALEALRKHNMSLTKASATYGIPSTTLWQRAHRLGIDTPKKEGAAKSWSDADLRGALQAMRAGAISANKASKAYGIPSSTLYKIARREGIRLAAPFNAAPTAWRRADLRQALACIRAGAATVQRAASAYGIPTAQRRADLRQALACIRAGAATVQRAASAYGIPTGTLYGRCKREGIELSRSNPTPWSENAMVEALEAVRVGQMSINQAAIHYNLPYSSLYGRFKRCKYQNQVAQQPQPQDTQKPQEVDQNQQFYYQQLPSTVHHPSDDGIPAYSQYPHTSQDYSEHYYNFSSIVTS
ncbi:hypothetical protein O3G_MSEX013544 [Manduca sexta]|nr:hypothetical protein O3G_MSEX013544 [Manduca sexta]